MAEKRMFTQKIIDSDPFTEMPLSAQALYFHLNMHADDDGFVNNPKKISRSIGAAEDDLKLLIAKRFIIAFENGVVTIKHWRMHNTLKKDRYKPTQYQEQFALLDVKGNNAYTEKSNVSNLEPEWNQTGSKVEPQYSIDKISIDKISIEESILSDSDQSKPKKPKPVKHKYGEYDNVLLTDDELQKLKTEYSDYVERIENLSAYIASTGKVYKSHYVTIRSWAKREAQNPRGRKEMVPDWMNKPKKNFFQDYDNDISEFELQMMRDRIGKGEPKQIDEELQKRVDTLKEQLGVAQ